MHVLMLRLPEVLKVTGMKRATLYKAVREGQFPAPFRVYGRSVAWRREEIEVWMEGLGRAE